MKRIASVLMIGVFVFGFALAAFAADGPAAVPPVSPLLQAPAANPAPAVTPAASAAPAAPAVAPTAPAKKAGLFVEGGLAGGAAAVELGYGRAMNDKLSLSGAVGYSVGNGYGVAVLDAVRLNYEFGALMIGAGLNYAIYSTIVSNIPGISGNISNKNLLGVELSIGKNFGKMIGKIGYSTALGLRAGLIYNL